MTPSGIEPATLRFLAQCLNQPSSQMLLWVTVKILNRTSVLWLPWILEMAFDTCADCRPFGATRMSWIGLKQN